MRQEFSVPKSAATIMIVHVDNCATKESVEQLVQAALANQDSSVKMVPVCLAVKVIQTVQRIDPALMGNA